MMLKGRARGAWVAVVCGLLVCGLARAQDAIRFADGDYAVSGGATVALPIIVESACPVAGFSFGVTHDASQLELVRVERGVDLMAALGGEPDPDFYEVNESPAGGAGFYAAVVLAGSGDTERLLPAGASTVFQAVYTATAEAAGGDTTVQTTAALGASEEAGVPAVALVLDVRPSADAGCDPNLPVSERDREVAPASETIFVSLPFIRGDADGSGGRNITDAVAILQFLTQGRQTNCAVAFNVDGSTGLGTAAQEDILDVNLTDAVVLLNFLFRSGPAPASPFPGCGQGDAPLAEEMACRESPCQ